MERLLSTRTVLILLVCLVMGGIFREEVAALQGTGADAQKDTQTDAGKAPAAPRSIYPDGKPVFDPRNPQEHATWKGRHCMPVQEARQLCHDLASYLGIPEENGASFLMEIAAAESDFGYYVRQVRGPAQSVWQIEPATARDMHQRLPGRNRELYEKILSLRDPTLDEEENVVTNLAYGGALCIGVLYLKGIRFETLSTLQARAGAWKKYYNTYLGKGTLEGYCQKVARHIGTALDPDAQFEETFDASLLASGDIFGKRNAERYTDLPEGFDESPIGQYYRKVLTERPQVFEEVPSGVLKSRNVRAIMDTLTLELMRKVQKDPAAIAGYRDMPPEILHPLARTALQENALVAYPLLPPELQADPEVTRIHEAQQFLQNLLQKR